MLRVVETASDEDDRELKRCARSVAFQNTIHRPNWGAGYDRDTSFKNDQTQIDVLLLDVAAFLQQTGSCFRIDAGFARAHLRLQRTGLERVGGRLLGPFPFGLGLGFLHPRAAVGALIHRGSHDQHTAAHAKIPSSCGNTAKT